MGADPDQHRNIVAPRTPLIHGVGRLLGIERLGILEPGIMCGQLRDQLGRAAEHIDRLPAPHRHDHLPGFQLAQVHRDRCPQRPGALRRLPAGDERAGGEDHAHRRRGAGRRGQELAAIGIDQFLVGTRFGIRHQSLLRCPCLARLSALWALTGLVSRLSREVSHYTQPIVVPGCAPRAMFEESA